MTIEDELRDDARQDAWVSLLEEGNDQPSVEEVDARTRVCLRRLIASRNREHLHFHEDLPIDA